MNINDSQTFTDQLASLTPASSGMDSRRVFYEAGFHAGGKENTSSTSTQPAAIVAACLMTLAMVAPASFYMGAKQADNSNVTDRIASQSPKTKKPDQALPAKKIPTPMDLNSPRNASDTNAAPDRNTLPPTQNDEPSVLAYQVPITRDLSQWARTLFPYKSPANTLASNQRNFATLSIGHGTWLSQTEDTAKMLDGAITANFKNDGSRREAEKTNNVPKFAPTPNALLKYFKSLETVQ
ncbi:MAG: hypothetical protein ACPGPS_03780 [Rubripirellula sp.]